MIDFPRHLKPFSGKVQTMIDSGMSFMDMRQPYLPVSHLLWPDSIESCGEEGGAVAEAEEVIYLGEEHECRNDASGLHSRSW